jgi:Phage integrase central domain
MASVWIRTRATKAGAKRYLVEYRPGGREERVRFAGSFKTRRLATIRAGLVDGELAAGRIPEVAIAAATPQVAPTLAEVAEKWRETRVDVAESTRVLHRVALDRVLPILGTRPVDEITVADVVDFVAALAAKGRKRETIRKSLKYLAAVLDFAGVDPNPARDRSVRLPFEEKRRGRAAERRSPRSGLPVDPGEASARAALPRLVGGTHRGDRRDARRRLRRASRPRAASSTHDQDSSSPLGRTAPGARRGDHHVARAARGSRPWGAALRRVGCRRPANVDREGVQGARGPAVVAARPAP